MRPATIEECLAAPERLAALDSAGALDAAALAELDVVAGRAASIFGAALGLVTLVTHDRLCIPAAHGMEVGELPLTETFCPQVVYEKATVVCLDASLDDRFSSRSVTVDWGVRFYVGAPVVVRGQVVGTVCVADTKFHTATESQLQAIEDLALRVGLSLSLRAAEHDTARKAAALDQLLDAVSFTSGLLRTGTDGRIDWLSPKMAEILDTPADELTGEPGSALLSQEALAELGDVDTRKAFHHEHSRLTRDGTTRWLESSVVPLIGETEQLQGYLALARDVTDRKHAELAMAKRERMLSTLVGNLPGVVFRANGNRFEMATGPVEEILGITPEELLAVTPRELIHPEDQEWVPAEIARAVERGERYSIRHRVLRHGEVRWVWTSGRAADNGDGRLLEGLFMDITDEVMTERRLLDSEGRYRQLVDHSPDPIAITRGNAILYVNQATSDMMGLPTEQLLRSRLSDFSVEAADRPVADIVQSSERFREGQSFFVTNLQLPDGRCREVEVRSVDVDWHGEPAIQSMIHDITDRAERHRSQAEQNLVLDAIARGEPLPVVMERIVTSVETRRQATRCMIVMFHPDEGASVVTNAGDTAQEAVRFVGQGWDLFGPEAADALRNGHPIAIAETIHGEEWPYLRAGFRKQGFRSAGLLPIETEAGVTGVIVITQRMPGVFTNEDWELIRHYGRLAAIATDYGTARARLQHEASHDHLTGLPNRVEAVRAIDAALQLGRITNERTAVLFVDLDNFKLINDTYGHAVGDQVIISVAGVFRDSLREADFVARIAGDEFLICCRATHEADLTHLVARIASNLNHPIVIDGHEHHVDASIGIATSDASPGSAEELLAHADAAMYEAKASGGGTHRRFGRDMHERVRRRLSLEGALRRALDHDEIVLHFQPEVDIASGRVLGAEALARWNHPEEGLVSPADFIPIAERTGLIVPLGELVLRKACHQASLWRTLQPATPLNIAVNLSARQLADTNLITTVSAALHDHDLPPALLTLELTETSMMQDLETAQRALAELRQLGVRLAIDDFGTGWSSFAYLKRFNMDIIKIDRAFIAGIADHPDDRAIVDAIAALALALDMDVVAEGVETSRQRAELLTIGVSNAQGFLWSRPLTAHDFHRLVIDGNQTLPYDAGHRSTPPPSSRLREALNSLPAQPSTARQETDALLDVLGHLVRGRHYDEQSQQ